MALNRRKSISFAWDILKSDMKLISYPILRIVAMFVLLAIMWPLIFDISAMEVADSFTGVANVAIEQTVTQNETSSESQSAATNQQSDNEGAQDISNIVGHMHLGWFLLFLVINMFIGVVSVGAITAQALATVRSENRWLGYGYLMAAIRMPQLLLWWLITLIVGAILETIEQHRIIGLIVAGLLGMAWSILTFFSITAIMATGCGPFGAITKSKQTVVDSIKKATGSEPSNLRSIRRGFYIGGPLAVINMILLLLLFALGFLDWRSLTQGGHAISAGAFGVILMVLYINGAFRSALYAILRATVYVWAEEGTVPASVDKSVFDGIFVTGSSWTPRATPSPAT
ncbi:MAG: DUF6159 family protein [Pirellulaceae bacterium]|nr:DUF6159 family protein [Pirellulaceae bacterium]